jgi:hypothetical protein
MDLWLAQNNWLIQKLYFIFSYIYRGANNDTITTMHDIGHVRCKLS